jgi:uncharacterized phage protein (TIGR02218 family)
VKTNIPALLLADLKADCTTLAYLWTISVGFDEATGTSLRVIRGTEHDLDIELPGSGDTTLDEFAGVYKAIANVTMGDLASNTDLSVDNMQVDGAFPDKNDDSPQYATLIDVTAAEIEDGLLDMAPVAILVCNWAAPSHGYWVASGGTLGQITRTSDGSYTTEVRGLMQLAQQIVIRTFSETCNAEFGDRRCGHSIPSVSGSVGVVTDRGTFAVNLDSIPLTTPMRFVAGKLIFTTGANTGLLRQVKLDPLLNGGVIAFWEEFPNEVLEGDEFSLQAGCDLQADTCKFYGNFNRIRAHGLRIPGVMAITAGPQTPQELGG